MTSLPPRVVLDTYGMVCPMPVIRLAKAIASIAPGAEIEVLSDDPAAKVDIPVWCRMTGHGFEGRQDRDRGWAFVVRRSRAAASDG